jgi:hypothetical protein
VAVVEVSELRKVYGDNAAVDGVSFSIEEGEVFALLGPNGAGKTTAVEILEGHRTRTSGDVRVLGFDPETGGRSFREQIGIVLQDAGLDEDFTITEIVGLYQGFVRRPAAVVRRCRRRGGALLPLGVPRVLNPLDRVVDRHVDGTCGEAEVGGCLVVAHRRGESQCVHRIGREDRLELHGREAMHQ